MGGSPGLFTASGAVWRGGAAALGGDDQGVVPAHALHVSLDQFLDGINAGKHCNYGQYADHNSRECEQRSQLVAEDAGQCCFDTINKGHLSHSKLLLHLGQSLWLPLAFEYFSNIKGLPQLGQAMATGLSFEIHLQSG